MATTEQTNMSLDLLEGDARKAATAALRKDIMDRRRAVEPEEGRARVDQHPDDNPAWDDTARVGVSYAPMGARRELAKAVENGNGVPSSALDEIIYQYRISGMRPSDIAARLPPLTEQGVNEILNRLWDRMETQLPSEIRMLQVARLEAIVNMLWNMATNGSVEHIDLLLKAIERLNKVFELESTKSRIEIDYITHQQSEVLYRAVQMAVEGVTNVFGRMLDQAGIAQPAPEIIEGTIADALDSAADTILLAESNPLVLEERNNKYVISTERMVDDRMPGEPRSAVDKRARAELTMPKAKPSTHSG